jgi:uncharacterized protein (TIGR03435 family)
MMNPDIHLTQLGSLRCRGADHRFAWSVRRRYTDKRSPASRLSRLPGGMLGVALGIVCLSVPTAIEMIVALPAGAQSARGAPKFEVATIKPSKNCAPGTRSGGGPSPGRLTLKCQPLTALIVEAYLRFADGRFTTQPRTEPIAGGPAWANSDLYEINAEAEGAPSEEMMRGPMMQALLEDRFQLRIHRETKMIPVYALVVAKRGLKLQPFREGSCNPIDRTKFPPPPADEKNCHARGRRDGDIEIVDAQAMSIAEFSKIFLGGVLDRPVLDQTGVAGRFDFHLEYGIDQATNRVHSDGAGPGDRTGPSIFTAVQEQLGLKLEPTTGPGEFLVIDHAERPSEN